MPASGLVQPELAWRLSAISGPSTVRPSISSVEDDFRAAVRLSVSSIDSHEAVTANLPLLSVAGALPLSSLGRWEQVVRDELALAQMPSAKKGKGWFALLSFNAPNKQLPSRRFLSWLDLASGDGFVRERALRTLAGPVPNAFFFALAARRLNDWVPQVRRAAREAIPQLARASDPEHVADALFALLVATWTAWGRLENSDKDVLAELVSADDIAALLADRVTSAATGPAAAVLAQALRSAALDKHLGRIATEAVQPSVRAMAHRTLLLGKAVWLETRKWQWTDVRYCQGHMQNVFGERPVDSAPDLADALNLALADRSAVVRRVAAQALVREVDDLGCAALPWAHQLATDAFPSIAERGAFVIQRLAANREHEKPGGLTHSESTD